MKGHSERDLLHELFPETARELFGQGQTSPSTLGLYPVGDGKLAFVRGDRLIELEPVEPAGKRAVHCDLCHVTRGRSEVGIYRAEYAPHRYRYVTLCLSTRHCQQRAGRSGLSALAEKFGAS